MLIIPPSKFRHRRTPAKRKAPTRPAPPVLALTAAAYDSGAATIELTCDRPVDLAAFNGSRVSVNDPLETNQLFLATGPIEVLSPETFKAGLNPVGDASGSDELLGASASNGI